MNHPTDDAEYAILYVDDESANLRVFQSTFKWYYEVIVAESGEEALAFLAQHPVQLIISDQRMPGMTGIELLKTVAERYPKTVRIILTGYTDTETVGYAINEVGIFRYLYKPWDADEMRHVIEKALSFYQLQADNAKLINDLKSANANLLEANKNLEQKVSERTQDVTRKQEKITASINYAERIQLALLTKEKDLYRVFPQSFALMMPRDIVSGDFCWLAKSSGYIYLSAVDCTGHGVPGAFMSIIGHQAMNDVLGERPGCKPSDLLYGMHAHIRALLNQDSDASRDGMDLGICRIDANTGECLFAGAKRPLVWSHGREVQVIKGSRYSVGGFQKDVEPVFEDVSLSLSPGDSCYLFSDGFTDQFGGKENRKYGLKGFVRLLEGVQQVPMEKQGERLQTEIQTWAEMTHQQQIDDILVIGFKF